MGIFTRLFNLYRLADSNKYLSKVEVFAARRDAWAEMKGLKILLLILLFTLASFSSIGQTVVTASTNGQAICSNTAAGGSAAAYTTLGDIVISETGALDFAFAGSDLTLTINAPAGWQFNPSSAVSYTFPTSGNITGIPALASGDLTTSTLTIKVSGSGTDFKDAFTISGLQVQATSSAAVTGFIYASSATGFNGIETTVPQTNFGNLSLSAALTPTVTISSNPGSTFCAGTIPTFTANPTNGGLSPLYQWRINGLNSGANSASNTFTPSNLISGDVVSVVLTSNETCQTTNRATSENVSITINPILPVSVSIAASETTICSGSPVTFTASPTNGGNTPVYQWQVNGVNAGTNSAAFTSTTLNNNDVVTVILTSDATPCAAGNPATSNSISVTVNPVLTPSVSISASGNTICSGTEVTFTAAPVNGGMPTYQWKVNGANAGTNSPTFISSTLLDGDVVTVDMTSTANCASASIVSSNSITMVVNNNLPVSVSISASSTTICAGASVTFTATPTNGGNAPVYQWQVNGVNTGINSATFTSSSLTNADVVKVILTSNATPCATDNPATSNSVIMVVNPNLVPSVSIAANPGNILCSGSSVTFTATPVNGGTPSYQWKVNGVNVGTNSPTYTTTNLLNGNVVTVDMTSTAACTTASTVTSNSITMVVNNNLPVSVSIGASATTICAGTAVTFTATPTNGGAAPAYQWQVNGVNAGTNNATFTSSTLKNTDVVRVILTSNATPCATGNPATSNSITMTVNPNATLTLTSAAATSNQEICKTAGVTNITYAVTGASTFTSTGLPPGVTATLTGGVITISGTPTNSATTTYNYTLTTTGSCANVSASGSIKVFAAAPANWNNGNQDITGPVSICPPTPNLVYTVPVLQDVQSYEWTLPTGFTITSGAGTNSITVSVGSSATVGNNQNITVTAKNPCGSNNTKTLRVNVNSFNGVTVNQATQIVCSNGTITVVGTLTGNAASGTWTAPSGTFSNIVTSTTTPITVTATYTPSILSGNVPLTITTNTPTGGGCPNVPGTATVNVTVNEIVAITAQPVVSQTVCSGGTVTLNVTASGTGLTYQWKKGGVNLVNGGNISGATSAALSLANVSPADNAVYTVVVSGSSPCAAITSTSSTLTVNQGVAISTPPVSQTVCSGSNVSFSVSATGTGITYQWNRNGIALANGGGVSGATSATLNLSSVTTANAGNYTVVISGTSPCAPITSSVASLTVNEAVLITGQPVLSQTVCSGGMVNFNVTATGTSLTYQWKKGGVNLVNGGNVSGATSPSLSLANVSPSDNAIYTVAVSGASPCGSVTSGNSTLAVNQAILITTQPVATQTLCSGNSVSFTVAASGTGLTYQWRKGTTNITGATSATLTLNSITPGDAANDYNVVISGTAPCAPLTSNNAALIVNEAVGITNQPVAQTLCSGSSATFNVTATGTGLTYQWKKGSANIAGATAATFTINNITSTDAGNYSVVVTGSGPCTPITSSVVALVVNQAVAITSQPAASQTVCSSFPVSFTVAATGTGLTYQWYRDGALLTNISGVMSGVTAATLSISQAALSLEGIYTVVVNGATPCGPVTSANAQLIVNQSLAITTQPISQVLCEGGNTSFTVAVTGDVASYEWRRNGIPVSGANFSGANTATLTLTGSLAANTGNYDVIITGTANSCSQVISNVATLTVNRNSTISLSSAAGTDTQTKCVNTALTNITYAIGGGGTGASITAGALPAGVSGSFSGGIFTISGTPTIAGTYSYTITTTGPCVNNSVSGTIIVNPNATIALSSAPGTNGQTICVNTPVTNITYAIGGGGTGASITAGAFPAGVTGSYSSGVYTISGSPTASGTFSYTITTAGLCANSSVTGTITVNPNATIALSSTSGTDTQTKCINTALNNITYAVSGGTGASITAGALPGGVTGTYTAGVFTISGTPTSSGIFNYTVTTAGPCGNNSVSGTITVTPNSTISLSSAAGTNGQTQCINTAITNIAYTIGGGGNGAIITAGALPSGVSGSYSGGVFTISGTPTVAGTFNYTVTTGGSCNNVSLTGTITVNPNTTISLSSAAGTDGQSKCISTPLTNITYAITGGTGASITSGSLPAGVTGTYSSGIFSIAGTPTESGTYNYTITTVGPCSQATVSGSIIISPLPVGGTLTPALREACVTDGGNVTLSGYTGSIVRWESSGDGGASWATVPNSTSATTITYSNIQNTLLYRAVISSGVCANAYSTVSVISVLVKATPITVATPAAICVGQSSVLSSTTGYPVSGITASSGNFSSANPAGWRRDGQTTGDFLPASRDNANSGPWGETNGPRTFSTITYNNGANGGKFAVVDGSRTSTLETSVFSLIGQNTSTFDFTQAYNLIGSATAIIEISTDGGATYTAENILAKYSGPATFGISGTTGTLQSTSISLASYIGLSNLRIRFRYESTTASSWAIDDVTVPAVLPITYVWSSSPASTFTDPTTGNVTVSPTETTTYTLTTYLDGCAAGVSSVTVTVNPLPTFTPAAATNGMVIACNSTAAQTIPLPYTATDLPTPATYSITWLAAATGAMFVNVVNAAIPAGSVSLAVPAGAPAGTYDGMITVNNANGCKSAPKPFRLVINPTPTLGSVTSAAMCNATGPTNMTVNLTGLLPNSTSTIIYQIGSAAAITVNGVTADASGVGIFQASVTGANDGQTLTISSISSSTAANSLSCPLLPTANNTMVLSISAGYVWTGAAAPDNRWSTLANWRCGVPINGSSVIIPQVANGNFPRMDVNFNSNNFELLGSATIELNGFTLELGTSVASTIKNEGSIIGSRSSTLNILGTLSQSLKFVQTTVGTTNALLNFTVNSPGRTATLGNALWVVGNVNPTAGIIASDGNLTMVSTSSTSSNITRMISPADVTGDVNVQSYITGDGVNIAYRGFRSMSSPIDDSKIASGGKKTYKQIKDYVVVTGPGGEDNGFDQGGWAQPYAETISTYYEQAPATSPAFVPIPNIDQPNIPGTGFFTFFRGSQGGSYAANSTKVNAPYAAPEPVTITYRGIINKFSLPATVLTNTNNGDPAAGYNLVGNPYPSSIDWNLVSRSAGVQDAVIIVKQGGGQASYINGVGNNGGSSVIQPGQGFLVITNTNLATITFKEDCKSINYPARLLRSPNPEVISSTGNIASFVPNKIKDTRQVLRLNLSDDKGADETTIVFQSDGKTAAGYEDVLYFFGSSVTLGSMSSDGKYLAINVLPAFEEVKEIKLNINSTHSGDFKLKFTDLPIMNNYEIFLKDSLSPGVLTKVEANIVYDLSIDKKNIATYSNQRLSLIVKQRESSLTSFSVKKQKYGMELNWIIEKPVKGIQFQPERSMDGKSFSQLSSITADGAEKFIFIDKTPVEGKSYYRIKEIYLNGSFSFSEIKQVQYSLTRDKSNSIAIYPNPVINDFELVIGNGPDEAIELNIFDQLGRKIMTQNFALAEQLKYNVSGLAPAIYILEVKGRLSKKLLGRIRFIKVE